MANFYTEHPELKFHLNNPMMERICQLKERNYRDKDEYDYAPLDYADAIDSYDRKLVAHFCEAEASSAADIRVYCEQALQSRTSSAGSVPYAGPCSVNSADTSGGSTRGAANNELK